MAIVNKASLKSFYMDGQQEVEVNNDSNKNTIYNINNDVMILGEASKLITHPDSEVDLSVVITNNTGVDMTKLHFFNTLGIGASHKVGSVKINNVSYETFDAEMGFDITETINKNGGNMTISFTIVLDNEPVTDSVKSTGTIQFIAENNQYELNSNEVEIRIVDNKIEIVKDANVKVVKSGDEIEYTIVITNKGTIENTKLFFKDVLPINVIFVASSVSVDGVIDATKDPVEGFDLDNLAANQSKIIKFKAIVL